MRNRQLSGILAVCFTLLIWLGACNPAETDKDSPAFPPGKAEITCEVYYRSAAGSPLEPAPALVFDGVNDEQSALFDTLLFTGRYSVDAGEGRAFSVAVSDPTNSAEITRTLYQLSPDGLRDQFVGGHGFTGLVYVFDPLSEAEMQYYCTVK